MGESKELTLFDHLRKYMKCIYCVYAMLVGFFLPCMYSIRCMNSVAFSSCRVRRQRDYEDSKNQRYPENKEKRSREDKETQNKTTEKESSVKEGKLHPFTPLKSKPTRGIVETGREKSPRQSAEKWKRLEDRELREKRCFICGREGHIKKECPQYKAAAGMKLINLSSLGRIYCLGIFNGVD